MAHALKQPSWLMAQGRPDLRGNARLICRLIPTPPLRYSIAATSSCSAAEDPRAIENFSTDPDQEMNHDGMVRAVTREVQAAQPSSSARSEPIDATAMRTAAS